MKLQSFGTVNNLIIHNFMILKIQNLLYHRINNFSGHDWSTGHIFTRDKILPNLIFDKT